MQAIILAAGRGSRLGGLTDHCPKCLVELENRPLLAWQIEVLREAGISEIVVVSGYRSNLIDDYANSYHFIARHNFRWRETNMLSTLFSVEDLIKGPCIVSYSDIIYGVEITKALMESESSLAIAYDPNWEKLWKVRFEDPLEDAESFRVDYDGRVLDIGRRVRDISEIGGQYVGLNRITPAALSWMKEVAHSSSVSIDELDMTGMLGMLASRNYMIDGIELKGGWCEIDNKKDLEIAGRMVRSGQINLPLTFMK